MFGLLDVFKYDDQYEENENKYKEIRRTILDESSDEDDDDESGSGSSSDDEDDEDKKEEVDEEENSKLKRMFDGERDIGDF